MLPAGLHPLRLLRVSLLFLILPIVRAADEGRVLCSAENAACVAPAASSARIRQQCERAAESVLPIVAQVGLVLNDVFRREKATRQSVPRAEVAASAAKFYAGGATNPSAARRASDTAERIAAEVRAMYVLANKTLADADAAHRDAFRQLVFVIGAKVRAVRQNADEPREEQLQDILRTVKAVEDKLMTALTSAKTARTLYERGVEWADEAEKQRDLVLAAVNKKGDGVESGGARIALLLIVFALAWSVR